MKKLLTICILLASALAPATAQAPLAITKIKLTLLQPEDKVWEFPTATGIVMTSNLGKITVSRVSNDVESWKVEGAGVEGTISTVTKGSLTAWNYVYGNDTIHINSNCTIYKDWYNYITWRLSDNKRTFFLAGDEPDCMSHYDLLIKADSIGCTNYGAGEKNTYIAYNQTGKICWSDSWKAAEKTKLPGEVSNQMRFASAFMPVISLTLRETERKRSSKE
jgi:hypothetical protein